MKILFQFEKKILEKDGINKMKQYHIYKIEFSYPGTGDKNGRWQHLNRLIYIFGDNQNDCEKTLKSKIGKEYIIKTCEEIPIHIITPEVLSSLFSENYKIFKNIKISKENDEIKTKKELESNLKRKKKEWYDIDQTVNSGNELKKEKEIWG